MIPKKIWQTHRYNREDLPRINSEYNLYDLSKRWQTMNPDYEYHYLNDEEMAEYIKTRDPELYTCIEEADKIKCGAMKADIFRYFVVYNEGGFWADMDTVPWRPIDDWYTTEEDVIISAEKGPTDTLNQYFFGSVPNHPAFKILLDTIKENFKNGIDFSNDMWEHDTTGPRVFGKVMRKYNEDNNNVLNIYPPITFDSESSKNGHLLHACGSYTWHLESDYVSWRDTFQGWYPK